MISVKGVATIGGIAAFGAVSAAVLAPAASADDLWAAIAYSPGTGRVGYTKDNPTREEAADEALTACGASDCRVVVRGPQTATRPAT